MPCWECESNCCYEVAVYSCDGCGSGVCRDVNETKATGYSGDPEIVRLQEEISKLKERVDILEGNKPSDNTKSKLKSASSAKKVSHNQ